MEETEPKIIRDLTKELIELGFDKEHAGKILEWVDTIPIRNYGDEDIKIEIKKGTVRIDEHLVDANDLSFNNLTRDQRLQYLWDNDGMYNPFEMPDDVILFHPWSGQAIHKDGTPAKMGNTIKMMMNPFSCRINMKIEYKNDKPYKRWELDENNEWIEAKLEPEPKINRNKLKKVWKTKK